MTKFMCFQLSEELMAKEGRMNNYMNTPLCTSGSPFSER